MFDLGNYFIVTYYYSCLPFLESRCLESFWENIVRFLPAIKNFDQSVIEPAIPGMMITHPLLYRLTTEDYNFCVQILADLTIWNDEPRRIIIQLCMWAEQDLVLINNATLASFAIRLCSLTNAIIEQGSVWTSSASACYGQRRKWRTHGAVYCVCPTSTHSWRGWCTRIMSLPSLSC